MDIRQNLRAVLHYETFDHMPVLCFGYWKETLEKWVAEGHLPAEALGALADGSEADNLVQKKLGFDYNYQTMCYLGAGIQPVFTREVVETKPDGSRIVRNEFGALIVEKDGAGSIPMEVGHTLVDRASWEKEFLPRLQWSDARADEVLINSLKAGDANRHTPLGLHAGSLLGTIRDWLGVEELCYLYMDDYDLYKEIIDTVGDLSYRAVKRALSLYTGFDYLHFWEDICFKNGPLVTPSVFEELVGPHYRRITELAAEHGLDIISVDCDGLIDRLIPIWLENGVNTMFPIEYGTWEASIAPWREQYGQQLRGVGGMNKNVFALDYAAVDREIERLKPLMALGGYIPCPDHRIPPDAKFENVQYYCDKMQNLRL